MKWAYVTLLLAALVAAVVAKPAEKGCVYSDYRLPQRIVPEHYDLRLDVDTDKFKYSGEVRIILAANNTRSGNDVQSANKVLANNVIVLHANATIAIDHVQFNYLDTETQDVLTNKIGDEIENICRHENNELLVITLKKELVHQSKGELVISFHANVNDDPDNLKGFYKNVYKTKEGEEKAVVSTQFEAVGARKAFPCFDEPNFKSTFDVTLVHDPKLVALSNGPIESEQIEPETRRKVTKYKRTPRMSTYLVAYTIGDYEHIEQVVSDGRLIIRAYTLPGRIEEARFSLETAVRGITLMEEYFDIQYAMDKIDMVALPTFEAGAMENWGLIFFKDDMLLYDPTQMASSSRGIIAVVVVHELAHQWFGNLVTMSWWSDLWLNEGFATWMENYFVNELYPEFEWNYDHMRVGQIEALEADAEPNTPSCQVEDIGRDPDALFNSVVYDKTGAIIRQVHDDYLGPERFREGIRRYIKKHVYGNTEANNLWDALKEVSGMPVDELIKSWITQPGHPEVEVELVKNGNEKSLHLKQSRRFSNEPTEEQKQFAAKQKWIIPISLIIADDKGNTNNIKLVMNSTETQVELPDWFEIDNKSNWVKLNAGFKGFYRVRYSRDLLMRLEKPCRSKALETTDRMNLIFDIFFGVNSDSLSNEELYPIMDWFSGDYEGAILLMKNNAFFYLVDNRYDEILRKFWQLILDTYVEIYNRQGFRVDSSESSQSDAKAISMALLTLVKSKHPPIVQDALNEFDKNGNKGNANYRDAVYWAVASSGSKEQIAKLEELRKEAEHPGEVARIEGTLLDVQRENQRPN